MKEESQQMDEKSRGKLSELIQRDPIELLPNEQEFIFGRRDYLTKETFDKFHDQLEAVASRNGVDLKMGKPKAEKPKGK